MVDQRKRLVRDLQSAHPDMKHTAAARLLDHAAALRPDAPVGWARLVCSEDEPHGVRYWKIESRTVGGDTWGTKFSPSWRPEDSPLFEKDLRDSLDFDGWLYPGLWPERPDAALLLPLWRSDRGQREDTIEAIHKAAGKDYHMVQELYAAAVADALDRAGVTCSAWFANPDEPRDLTIELEFPPGDYASTSICWREDQGWYWVPFSDDQSSLGDFAADLDCAFLALPDDVAAAVLNGVATADKPATEPAIWTPPPHYAEDPDQPEDDLDYSIKLERSLAAYATHPANQRIQSSVATDASASPHASTKPGAIVVLPSLPGGIGKATASIDVSDFVQNDQAVIIDMDPSVSPTIAMTLRAAGQVLDDNGYYPHDVIDRAEYEEVGGGSWECAVNVVGAIRMAAGLNPDDDYGVSYRSRICDQFDGSIEDDHLAAHRLADDTMYALAAHLGGPSGDDIHLTEAWLTAWGAERTVEQVSEALARAAEEESL